MYNLDALSMSYDKLKNKVITVTQKIDDEKFSKCIKIQDSEMNVDYIPQNMYTLFEEIQNLENKQNIIGKLVKLEENIKSKIHKIEESIKIKNNLVDKKSVNKNRTYQYSAKNKQSNHVYPNKKLRKELNDIFRINDFDMQMSALFKYIDKNGIDYSRNPLYRRLERKR